MQQRETATILFSDDKTSKRSVIIVRVKKGQVTLCISTEGRADMEICLNPADCEALAHELRQASLVARVQKAA